MLILGIHDGHCSSACLMKDGNIIFALQEERLTAIKNTVGFPRMVVEYILKEYKISGKDIDEVAVATVSRSPERMEPKIDQCFDVADHIKENIEYWGPKLSGKEYPKNWFRNLNDDPRFQHENDIYRYPDEIYNLEGTEKTEAFKLIRQKCIAEFLGIDSPKVKFYDHHTCHIYYTYFSNPDLEKNKKKWAGLTIDAYGDGKNQTVWSIENGHFELLIESNQCELARVYRTGTLYLGMKPLEHEFKVMGLAPYCKDKYAKPVRDILKPLLKVEGLKIVHGDRPNDLWKFFEENFRAVRFDSLAGGLQLWLEEVTNELVNNIYKETGIRNFLFSGGCAMNVKLNMQIAKQDIVDDLFVGGSSSDESLSIGVCYLANKEKETNLPLKNLYLGNSCPSSEINEMITELKKNYNVKEVTADQIATMLAKGQIVARVAGRTEFGARALGNRTIMANPSLPGVVKIINEMIKGRDFWMPFALSTTNTFADKYLENPKKLNGSFMAMAFDTKKKYLESIKSGTHPYDETVRPQIVTKKQNLLYHELIEKFEEKTGIGALLNTSLNLHGLPLVATLDQALHVFENSGLSNLVINSDGKNILIQK